MWWHQRPIAFAADIEPNQTSIWAASIFVSWPWFFKWSVGADYKYQQPLFSLDSHDTWSLCAVSSTHPLVRYTPNPARVPHDISFHHVLSNMQDANIHHFPFNYWSNTFEARTDYLCIEATHSKQGRRMSFVPVCRSRENCHWIILFVFVNN